MRTFRAVRSRSRWSDPVCAWRLPDRPGTGSALAELRLSRVLLWVAFGFLAVFGQTATSATIAGIPFLIAGALFLLSDLLVRAGKAPVTTSDSQVPVG